MIKVGTEPVVLGAHPGQCPRIVGALAAVGELLGEPQHVA
jgi:hypothetical protein